MDISLDIQASSASVIWFEKLSRDHQLSWRKLLKIIILNFILYIIHFCFVWRESLTLVSEPTSRRIIRWLRFQSFIWKSRRLCNDTDKDVTKNILTKFSINKWPSSVSIKVRRWYIYNQQHHIQINIPKSWTS
jgi:hypothetical protein